MKITIFGKGKMGTLVDKMARENGTEIVEIDSADVCIDFSHKEVVLDHISAAIEKKVPIVIGTTGWDCKIEQAKQWIQNSQTAALYSPNFSLGIAHFLYLLKLARQILSGYEVAGIEYHHNQKKDNPSGTAIAISKMLNLTSSFSSVRLGSFAGKHEVLFDSPEDLITISHEAHSREGFARGSLKAAEWLRHKTGWFTLDDMLRSLYSTDHPL